MIATIHYNGTYQDEIRVSGDTIEELRTNALYESDSRGWERCNCWSEVKESEE